MKKLKYTLIYLFLISASFGSAQNLITNGLVINPDVSICQGSGDCVDLTATYFTPKDASANYLVNSIPFDPVTVTVNGGLTSDDEFSQVIDLGFTFCYFGNSSNQLVIGGNGDISFDTSLAGQYDEWAFTDDVPSPNLPSGGVFGAYHDMDISVDGNISYGVTGTAPFRAFVINYYVAQFSCNSQYTTQQIVLHETSNFIDVYITDIPNCPGWNGGNAVIGIQNIGGTIGYAAPGRNTSDSPWTTTNEAWRFEPDGADVPVVFTWLDDTGTPIGNNTTENVCPTTSTFYTAQVEYTYCDGSTVTNTAQVNITADSSGIVSLGSDLSICNGTTALLTASGTFSGTPTYEWLLDGVVIPGATSNTYPATILGTYTVNVTFGTCTATDTIIIGLGNLDTNNNPPDIVLIDDNNDGIMLFDLTTNNTYIANGLPGLIFSYHLIEADAIANINAIITPYNNITNPQEIWVRVEDPITGCVSIMSFNLIVITPNSCFDAGVDQTIDCTTAACVDLVSNYVDGNITTSYNVQSIPYAPAAAYSGLANSVNGFQDNDDTFSDVIDIPFPFSFFGTCYSQLVIGNNGVVSFDTTNANGNCTWIVDPLPDPSAMTNTIFGVHQDIYISHPGDGEISWETLGTAPNRIFVASFNNLYSYSCTTEGSTFQIALYETSHNVEVHIETRCSIDGLVGIQNDIGSVAYSAPGRNGGTWSTTNESWQFAPNGGAGTPDYTVTWYDGITNIGTGDSINVCPAETTTYTAQLFDNNTGQSATDVVTVTVENLDPVINAINGNTSICYGDVSTLTVDIVDDTNITYEWQLDGVTLTETSDTLTITQGGDYTVIATNPLLCSDTLTISVVQNGPVFTISGSMEICSGQQTIITANTTDSSATFSWELNGSTIAGEISNTLTVTQAGVYSAIVSDTLGCSSIEVFTITELSNCIIPEGISPNGDGLNDSFDISFLEVNNLTIFNRHGVIVYEKTNYTNEWVGQSKGNDKLPTGTYFYVASLTDGSQIKKWVYLNKEN